MLQTLSPTSKRVKPLFPGTNSVLSDESDDSNYSPNVLGNTYEQRAASLVSDEQLACILQIMGTPSAEEVCEYDNERIRHLLSHPKLPRHKTNTSANTKATLGALLPNADDDSLSLLVSMLELNPRNRITATGALQSAHILSMPPEWRTVSNQTINCTAEKAIEFAFEELDESQLTIPRIRALILEECANYQSNRKKISASSDASTSSDSATSPKNKAAGTSSAN